MPQGVELNGIVYRLEKDGKVFEIVNPLQPPVHPIYLAQYKIFKETPYNYTGRTYLDCDGGFPEFNEFNNSFTSVIATTTNTCGDNSWQTIYEATYGDEAIWKRVNSFEITFDNLVGVDTSVMTLGVDRAVRTSSSGNRNYKLYYTPISTGIETLIHNSGNLNNTLTNFQHDLLQLLTDAGLSNVVAESDKLRWENENVSHCGFFIGVGNITF